MTRPKVDTWFNRGATALGRVLPEVSLDMYVCPLCLNGFFRNALVDGRLTLEHVPPEKLGGRPLVLTCRECNSRAGSELDVHAVKAEAMVDFLKGQMTRPVAAWIRLPSGAQIKADVRAVGSSISAAVHEKGHKPGGVEHAQQTMLAMSESANELAPEFKVDFYGALHSPKRASISRLRSAYLVLFAALGYRYVLQTGLNVVRDQIADPEGRDLGCFGFVQPKTSERQVLLVTSPEELRSYAVRLGHYVIFLPRLGASATQLYEAVDQRAEKMDGGADRFLVRQQSWPNGPQFTLDFS